MKELVKRYREWRRRTEERSFAKWAVKRKKGRSYFVSGVALYFCVFVTTLTTLSNYFIFGVSETIASVTFRIIFSFITGLLIGLLTWHGTEKRYLRNFLVKETDLPEAFLNK